MNAAGTPAGTPSGSHGNAGLFDRIKSAWSARQRGGGIGQLLIWLAAALWVAINETRKWAQGDVYDGISGALRALLGGVLGLGGAIYAGHKVGWEWGQPWYCWLPAATFGFAAVVFYIWPLAYRLVIRPLYKLAEALYEGCRKFAAAKAEPTARALVGVFSRLPLSGRAWDHVFSKKFEDSLVGIIINLLTVLSTTIGTMLLGMLVYFKVSNAEVLSTTQSAIAIALGAAGGLLTIAVLLPVLYLMLHYGKFAATALAAGIAVAYQFGETLTALGYSWDFQSPLWPVISYALVYVLFVAYVFPWVAVVLTSDALVKLWRNYLQPLPGKVYDDRMVEWDGKRNRYPEWFAHMANLAVSAAIACGAGRLVSNQAGLTAAVALGLVALVCTMIALAKLINTNSGNGIIGGGFALAAGIEVMALYWGTGLATVVLAVGAAAVVALAVGLVLFPLCYLTVKLCLVALAEVLPRPLVAAYDHYNSAFNATVKKVDDLNEKCYEQRDEFHDLVAHLINLLVAVTVFTAVFNLGLLAGVSLWLPGLVAAVAMVLSHLLVGKVLLWRGVAIASGLAGLGAAALVGTTVYAIDNSAGFKLMALATAGLTWWAVSLIIIPVAYGLVRKIAGKLLVACVLPLLEALYTLNWSWFAVVYDRFTEAVQAILRLLQPVISAVAAAAAKVKEAYRKILDRIRGRTSR